MATKPQQHAKDKREYEFIYSIQLAEEKYAWYVWRKILAMNVEWKYLSAGFKHAFRHTHMLAYCKGKGIPTLMDYLNFKETERNRDSASIGA